MPSRTLSKSVVDDLCHRVKALSIAVMRLQNRRTVVIGIYNHNRVPQDLGDGVLYFSPDTEEFNLRVDGSLYTADASEVPL